MDLLLRNARLLGADDVTDIAVDGGRVSALGAVGAGATGTEPTDSTQEIDLGGRLVTPPLVEPHIHLDAVLTVGQPRPNVSGSLFEGIAVWAERVQGPDRRGREAPRAGRCCAGSWRTACSTSAATSTSATPSYRAARPGRAARGGRPG